MEIGPYLDANGNEQEYDVKPVDDGDPDYLTYVIYGDQVVMDTAIVGIANTRQIALGGGGNQGAWGQGGMGTSASMQQMVTQIQLRRCQVSSYRVPKHPVVATVAPPPVTPAPPVVYVEKKAIRE